jgi:hypothetical protein
MAVTILPFCHLAPLALILSSELSSTYEFGFCHSERSEESLEKKEILLFLHGVYPELVKGSGLRMTKS